MITMRAVRVSIRRTGNSQGIVTPSRSLHNLASTAGRRGNYDRLLKEAQEAGSFSLSSAAQFHVERRQRQSVSQRKFQVRRIVHSQAMTLRQRERGSSRLPVRLGIAAARR